MMFGLNKRHAQEEEIMGRTSKDPGQINGLIDKGCSIEGKFTFDGTVQINGDFRGEILSDGTLIVGPESQIDARIQVDTIVVEGTIHGTVEAKTKIELRSGCKLIADIIAPSLMIEDGAMFQGQCQMLDMTANSRNLADKSKTVSDQYSEDGSDSLIM